MKLIDNINETLRDDLLKETNKGTKISIIASSFSIYAFESLRKEFKNIDELRFFIYLPYFRFKKIH